MFADAKARAARGEMKPVTTPPDCEHTAGTPTSGDVGVFDCFMITSRIPKGKRNPEGALGYPFRAVVNYETFTYTWCKTELIPGEMLVLAPKDVTLLPQDCQGPKARHPAPRRGTASCRSRRASCRRGGRTARCAGRPS